ncbi:hypothetical protein L9F63_021551, partial [Diploptera punctata]
PTKTMLEYLNCVKLIGNTSSNIVHMLTASRDSIVNFRKKVSSHMLENISKYFKAHVTTRSSESRSISMLDEAVNTFKLIKYCVLNRKDCNIIKLYLINKLL